MCIGLDVSPKHAVRLSLALHEPATNATKCGALSRRDGCVSVQRGMSTKECRASIGKKPWPSGRAADAQRLGNRLLKELGRDLDGNANPT